MNGKYSGWRVTKLDGNRKVGPPVEIRIRRRYLEGVGKTEDTTHGSLAREIGLGYRTVRDVAELICNPGSSIGCG